MGGKSYFCDYCRCYMKNDINVRKIHNDGLAHKIIKVSYMRKYEDPRKVYEEEISKQPCTRYLKGYCKFDLFCQFTHFNETQLKQLKQIVDNINQNVHRKKYIIKSTRTYKSPLYQIVPDCKGLTKNKLKQLPKNLPLSLRPLNLKKLSKIEVINNKWG